VLLIAVALAASAGPARRAAQTDPPGLSAQSDANIRQYVHPSRYGRLPASGRLTIHEVRPNE
jgi:hypothetical protein